MTMGIYKITNTVNNKIYIGQSINIEKRILAHKYDRKNSLISKAIHKYGWESFVWGVLETCELNQLDSREQYYIDTLAPCDPDSGYNMLPTVGVNPMLGRRHSAETVAKIKKKLETRDFSGENNPFWGKTHSETAKIKMSEKRKNQYLGDNNPFFGRTHTDETKNKISKHRKELDVSVWFKKVVQIDKESGDTIAIWDSLSDAAEHLSGNRRACGRITAACKQRIKTALGYKWKYYT